MASVLFKFGDQAAYDALASGVGYDTNSLYFIEDTARLYKGSVLMSEQAIFVSAVPEFESAKSGRIYVVTAENAVSLYVKGATQMVQAGGGTIQPGAITSIEAFDDGLITTSTSLEAGVLPDSDTVIPTSGAVKDAIETAIQGVTDDITALGDPVTGASAQRNSTNNGTVITLTRASGTNPITVNVSDLFLTSAEYDSVSHTLKLYVQGVSDPVEVDLGQLIPQAVTTSDVSMADEIVVNVAGKDGIGNFKNGDTIDPSEFTDLQSFLVALMSQDTNPTTTQPSVSVSLTGAGAKEVGTEFTPSWSVTLNPGAYSANKDGAQPTNVTATSYTVTDTNSGSASTQSGSFTKFTVADDTNYRVSATVAHTAGAVPTTYLGQPYPDGQIQAGIKSGQSSAVTGFRKGFYGAVSSKAAAIDSAFVRGLSNSTNSAPANGNTWTIQIPVGTLRVAFAYPATLRDVTTVVDAATKYDVKTAFTKSTVSVEGANSYSGINYKVYVTDFANPTDAANTYTVTI